MFNRKKPVTDPQKTLADYQARLAAAQATADVGEKYAALMKLHRRIEKKSVKTAQVKRRTLFKKYGFVIAIPPAIATTTALLVSVIGYPAFAFSMALAWVGGIRALNKAEQPPETIPYRLYKARKDAEAAPFRTLQQEIKAAANDAVAKATVEQLQASPNRRLLARKFPHVRKMFNEAAMVKTATKHPPNVPKLNNK